MINKAEVFLNRGVEMKITVVGSINVDNVLNIKRFPKIGETISAMDYNIKFGGKGANQAVAACKLGAEVSLIGAVGKDDLGKQNINNFKNFGMNVEGIKISDNQTGCAMISVDESGNNKIIIYPGANNSVDEEQIKKYEYLIKECDLVMLQFEIPMPSVEYAAKIAKKYGKTIILNPAPARKISDSLLEMADYITPNETELMEITGISDIKKGAKNLIERGAKNVIVTLGDKGCFYINKNEEIKMDSFKINAVDSTAAGDSFNAAFSVAICENKTMKECLRFANAVGALTAAKQGAQNSLPCRNELENFLNSRNN